MPLPSIMFSARRLVLLLVLLGALAAGALLLFGGQPDQPSEPETMDRDPKAREPLSDDPLVRKLSVPEQVDQVLLSGFDGEAGEVPEGLGAILVGSENGAQAAKVLAKGTGDIPPLVVASQEGGEFRSFPDLPPAERQLDIGREDSPEAARTWAAAGAKALGAQGFHLNLFPVADVATLDSPLAGRAFSDDPALVARLTEEALVGCDEAGLACAPLHFPGLGLASQDTARGPATVSVDDETLEARDLVPFRAALRSKAPAVVLSLGLYPAYDPIVPAALSKAVATDLLRKDVGFKGVAISDDLESGAVQVTYSTSTAAVEALRAGVDLIQISDPGSASAAAEALVEAVKKGDLPKERLAEAAERVVRLKRQVGLID